MVVTWGKNMKIDIQIDKLTPCLIEVSTGIEVLEEVAQNVMAKYTLEGDLNVK